MTESEYHEHPAIGSSDLKHISISVLHYEHKKRFKLDSQAVKDGSLIHRRVLEPHTMADHYVVEAFEGAELSKNSKAYKEAKAAFEETAAGKISISLDKFDEAEQIAKSVDLIAGGLFKNGVAETPVFAKDEYSFERKCKPDYYLEDYGIVIDLKTTASCKPYDFQKSIYDYSYHRQAAWYLDTLRLAGKPAEAFIIVAVEKSKPYTVRVFKLDEEAIEIGRKEYTRLLEKLKRYQETGEAEVIESISLPKWAIKESEELS